MNNLYVNNFVLEVTRKCNFQCDHCLRGDSQDFSMSRKVIEKIKEIMYGLRIETIIFTGGEPLLAPDILNEFIRFIIDNGIDVNSFYMVTNGSILDKTVLFNLMDLYNYCKENNGNDVFSGTLCVSHDDGFHDDEFDSDIINKNRKIYSSLKFYNDKEKGNLNYDSLIRMGNADLNFYPGRYLEMSDLKISKIEDDVIEDNIYINSIGDICGCCDLSYSVQERYNYGNILKDDFFKIINDIEIYNFNDRDDTLIIEGEEHRWTR